MKARKLLALGAAVAVVGGAAGGLAAGASAQGARKHPIVFVRRDGLFRLGAFRALADYLDLTPPQLVAQLRSGKSLADIASAQGKSLDGVKSTILNTIKARLDKAVAANRITSAREQTVLNDLQSRLDTIVTTHPLPRLGVRGLRGLGDVVTTYLGLTAPQLRDQLGSGKSLAEIATAQGKTVDGLKTAILDAIKSRLDNAVSANRISSAQEQTFLSNVQARLDNIVNRHFGQHTP